jgi:ABC-type cobalamin transport system permease subunit
LGLVILALALATSTQYVAASLDFHRLLGTPLATVAGVHWSRSRWSAPAARA